MGRVRGPARPSRIDVTAGYDLGVERYEELWSPVILPAAVTLVARLGIDAGGPVLDVGGGTGAVAEAIRSAAPSAPVLVVDASREMLRVAHGRRGLPVVQADAGNLPITAETVSTTVLAYVLFHLADPLAALQEAARVTRSGGRIGTVTWMSEPATRAHTMWNEALDAAGAPPRPLRQVDTGLDNPRDLGGLLGEAGLTPQDMWPEELHRQWDPASFWALATGSGADRQRLGALDADARATLLVRLRAQLQRLTPEDYRWHGQVLCAVARKPEPRS